MTRLDVCLDWIFRAEGGLSDDPSDRGGLTRYGISQRAYPNLDIQNLTKAEARAIYERDYWQPCHCEALPEPLDQVMLDCAVLMGRHAATELLQRSLKVKVDGIIGVKTLAAATDHGVNALTVMFTERMIYLSNAQTWQQHRRGWTLRTFELAREVFSGHL